MVIIYGRNDLHKPAMNKPIMDIELHDIIHESAPMHSASVIIFRDRSGRCKVLKNRYDRIQEGDEIYIEVKEVDWIQIR